MSAGGTPCSLCGGACGGTSLAPLTSDELSWLWDQIAQAADRRGDPALTSGTLSVQLPDDPAARAAAVGLITERPLTSRRKSIDLARLTVRLQRRSPALTPGAVAAHHRGAPLAARARQAADRLQREIELTPAIAALAEQRPLSGRVELDKLRDDLRRSGWLARLLRHEDPIGLLEQALRVLAELPEDPHRADRRRIAEAVTGDPHALDDGAALPGLTLAVLTSAGLVPAGSRTRPAWASVGVALDDLTGGLMLLGLRPQGWKVPAPAVITLPPRELARATWASPPTPGQAVHITENPSVIAAASDLAASGSYCYVVCTAGTPAAAEIDALAALPELGWRVRVRADFDVAGVEHVRALLAGIPDAEPWRMSAADYEAHAHGGTAVRLRGAAGATPWDPRLAEAMAQRNQAVYEETLLPVLLHDLATR